MQNGAHAQGDQEEEKKAGEEVPVELINTESKPEQLEAVPAQSQVPAASQAARKSRKQKKTKEEQFAEKEEDLRGIGYFDEP